MTRQTLRLVRPNPTAAPSDEPPDDVLVRLAQQGEREAMGILYTRFYPVVHGMLLAHADRDDVADLAHDVFTSAIARLDTLRDPSLFGGWLAQIARNAARMHHRRKRRLVPLEDDIAAARHGHDTTDTQDALAALRSLPPAYRESLTLRLVEGLSGPEIAVRLGMTHGSVRVNLSKGMEMLRRALGEPR